jgi:hypothetical protein
MTNKGESFESTVEDIEKEHGIVDPSKKKKPLIVIDSAGRYWRYTDDRTFKWRVRPDGSRFYRAWEEYQLKKRWQEKLIANEKDKEVKKLLKEEIELSGGATAQQWSDFEKKKESARSRGKRVHDNIKPQINYNSRGDMFVVDKEPKPEQKKNGMRGGE